MTPDEKRAQDALIALYTTQLVERSGGTEHRLDIETRLDMLRITMQFAEGLISAETYCARAQGLLGQEPPIVIDIWTETN